MPTHTPLLVVLDLDETLIAARPAVRPQRKPDFWWAGRPIYLRPHVRPFLEDRFERGHVAIWTASDAGYALPILERILQGPTDRFRFVWTREQCVPSDHPDVPRKPIQRLLDHGADARRVVLVDDRPATFGGDVGNGRLIPSYHGDRDDDALQLLAKTLQGLDRMPDVREAL